MNARARAALVGLVFVTGCSDPLTPALSRWERVASPAGNHHPSPFGRGAGGEGVARGAGVEGCRAPLGLDVVPVSDARSGWTVVMARVHGRLLAYAADEDASVMRILDVEAPAELASVPMP